LRTILIRALAASFLITLAGPAPAEPVQWPGNGHFYEVVSVPGTISWEDANTAAAAASGYLATITSPAENDFVFSLVNNPVYWHGFSGPWLGGYQDPATQQPSGNWRWVTGEPWTYTNWQAGQPNDSGGKAEDKLQFGFAYLEPVWNDIMSLDSTPAYRPIAYVLEWDHDPLVPALQVRRSQSPPELALCWQTAPNRFYQLLCSSVLNTNQWVPLSTNWIWGDGTIHCEIDLIDSISPTKFYRLLCTNAPPP
jgi:hypothetical protein